jgi:signal transduction histidine kinase
MEEDSLYVIIADNGKGMNVSQELEKGNGLKNMEYRSKEICADFMIESNVEKGTTISLKLQPKLEKLP